MKFFAIACSGIILVATPFLFAVAADDERVSCCRFDCAPQYCKDVPRACYNISRERCEEWIGHGHARIVKSCSECEYPRYQGSGGR
jgi:hypothetical protein